MSERPKPAFELPTSSERRPVVIEQNGGVPDELRSPDHLDNANRYNLTLRPNFTPSEAASRIAGFKIVRAAIAANKSKQAE